MLNKSKRNVPEYLRKRSSAKINNLDHLLNVIGSFGLYQKIQFLLVGFLAIVPSMVAYSYVFVSATPKFTCSVVREIQLVSYENSESSSPLNYETKKSRIFDRSLGLQNEIQEDDDDDPFKNFKLKRMEYFIETRRFIRLYSDEDMANKSEKIHFDNNCVLTQDSILKKYQHASTIAMPTTTTKKSIATSKRGSNLLLTTLSSKKVKRTNLKCVEWIYDESVYGRTTVTDMNLVCLNSHLKAVTQNAFILGKIVI
jgi:hypothetical protein